MSYRVESSPLGQKMPEKIRRIKVLIVDNEEVFREGLTRILKEHPVIDVVGWCKHGKEAIQRSKDTRPDVILMDSEITEGDILTTISDIRKNLPVIKLVTISHPEALGNPLKLLRAGATACLARNITIEDLIKSIELASSGRLVVSPLFSQRVIDELTSLGEDEKKKLLEKESILSDREKEIATLVAQGATNKEMAQKLLITENTIKVHIKNILAKLELRNRQQLAVYAFLQKWIGEPAEALDRSKII